MASNNLTAVDITTPIAPSVLGSCNTNYTASDLKIVDNYAYITSTSIGLLVVSLQ